MGKKPRKATSLGTYGERVARERAARRRAARERAGREQGVRASNDRLETEERPEPQSTEPEIIEIPHSDLANEVSVLAALIMSGLARSHPEARRRFREDGISVNDAPVMSDKAKLRTSDVSPEGVIKLGVGDAQVVLLRPV